VIWSKEIEVLQALSSIPTPIKSKDLQSLVYEISSAAEEARNVWKRRKLTDTDSVMGKPAKYRLSSFFQNRRYLKNRHIFESALSADMELE
jgi:hypothetical protein